MIKRLLTLPLLLLIFITASAIRPEDVPNVQRQRYDQWVSDPAGLLSPEALMQANQAIDKINRANTTEICAVIVPDLSDIDANDYATQLFELWGVGRKDRSNGLLLLISRDDRKAVIRTGSGMEIAMTDGRSGSVIRYDIAPAMREGNIDKALLDAIASIGTIVSDPAYYDDLHSDREAVRSRGGSSDNETFFRDYIYLAVILTIALIAWMIYTLISSARYDSVERYTRLNRLWLPAMMLIPLTLGIGIIAFVPLWLILRHLRLKRHNCPNCGTRMHRLDEVTDNEYLTPAQDTEERLKSVDYDVWLCPNCNETDIIPYINKRSTFSTCPVCGARAESLQSNRILRHPTPVAEGIGQRDYHCLNCGNRRSVPYKIAKTVNPPIFLGGGGRGFGGGGFGGGSFGGGFGGGSTSGGGASGSW
ncbi:MAG: TPM domain-containing protein [Muribaculaceae bacterium]|nr:TPM domain-containing protein [Muribaculaceae bacterium]